MIIVSVTGPTTAKALEQIERNRHVAHCLELRLDLIRRPDLTRLIEAARKPVIATCRPEWEGGEFAGTERQRIELLEVASLLGARYVDIELRAGNRAINGFLGRRRETRVIVSRHLAPGAPVRVRQMFRALRASGADIMKFAYHASDAWELGHALEFLALARAARLSAIAVALGEAGEASRVLYRRFGGWGTYASAGTGEESAPGQIDAATLRDFYRAHRLTRRTRIFGVVGMPVRQSKGVVLHNSIFHRLNIDAVYCRFPVQNLARFMKTMGGLVAGLSVTIPHKQTIIRHLDRIDPTAKAIGAVNTVLRKGRVLLGMNTDAPAALDALERVTAVAGKSLLILGAGGAARAVAYEAKARGAIVTVMSRTEQKSRELARDLGVRSVPWKDLPLPECEILVNATPVGMIPDGGRSPVSASALRGKTVLDVVYAPPRTRLLLDAERAGSVTVAGTEMYLNQAARQAELYTGRRPARTLMRRILFRGGT